MSVGEICNREVVIVDRNASIYEAVKLMRRHHVGDVVVVEERGEQRVPVGILTDRDVVVEILAEDVELDAVAIKDVMSFELLTANENDELMETMSRMQARGVRRVPVVNGDGGLEGILTVDDIVDVIAEQMSALTTLIKREQKKEHEGRR